MAPTSETDKPRQRRALIVAGPTCSGKSALALHLAQRCGGTVINADSMQVYRELRILTARPTPAEEAAAPHRLYGVRPAAQPGSVAWWHGAALAAMDAAQLPILCGGTGLYLRSLVTGLADIPDPGEAARTEARALLATEGAAALHARLRAADPDTASTPAPDGWPAPRPRVGGLARHRPRPGRLAGTQHPGRPVGVHGRAARSAPCRAARRDRRPVHRHAGRRRAGGGGGAAWPSASIRPCRRCARTACRNWRPTWRGHIALEEANRRAVLATGQYTKRQATWFRHQALAHPGLTDTINARFTDISQLSESWMAGMQQFMHHRG